MSLAVKQYRLMQIPSSDTAIVTDTNGGGIHNSSNISFHWENGIIKSINLKICQLLVSNELEYRLYREWSFL